MSAESKCGSQPTPRRSQTAATKKTAQRRTRSILEKSACSENQSSPVRFKIRSVTADLLFSHSSLPALRIFGVCPISRSAFRTPKFFLAPSTQLICCSVGCPQPISSSLVETPHSTELADSTGRPPTEASSFPYKIRTSAPLSQLHSAFEICILNSAFRISTFYF